MYNASHIHNGGPFIIKIQQRSKLVNKLQFITFKGHRLIIFEVILTTEKEHLKKKKSIFRELYILKHSINQSMKYLKKKTE